MKAIVWTRYGPPEVLQLKDIPKPVPKDREVLIRIHAATVHTGDCELRRFDLIQPFWLLLRLIIGIFRPRKNTVLGMEVSGEVEAIGKRVTRFKPGDKVFTSNNFRLGGYAEYICLPETYPIALKPSNISWEQAACINVGGTNALHFLRLAHIQPGERVLIYGSSGSIGTFAVQLAKFFGAHVTALCSTDKVELVRSIGADDIIDYTQEDFAQRGEIWDVIFDTIGKSPYGACLSVLGPKGRYLLANPTGMAQVFRAAWDSRKGDRKVITTFADHNTKTLEYLADLIAQGVLTPVVGRTFPLEQAVEAHRHVEQGHKTGNVVLSVAP